MNAILSCDHTELGRAMVWHLPHELAGLVPDLSEEERDALSSVLLLLPARGCATCEGFPLVYQPRHSVDH